MLRSASKIPVAVNEGGVRVVVAENRIINFGGPDSAHTSFSTLQKAINYSMTSILTTGGIQDGAICVIKEVRIAGRSLYNVECKVVKRMIEQWVIGQKNMKQLGNYEFDTKEQKLKFK